MALDILHVDDEADNENLWPASFRMKATTRGQRATATMALAAVANRLPNMIFSGLSGLQGSRLDGLQLLDDVKLQHPELPIVMISGHGNIENRRCGDQARLPTIYIEKPFKEPTACLLVAQRALENSRLKPRGKGVQATRAFDVW